MIAIISEMIPVRRDPRNTPMDGNTMRTDTPGEARPVALSPVRKAQPATARTGKIEMAVRLTPNRMQIGIASIKELIRIEQMVK